MLEIDTYLNWESIPMRKEQKLEWRSQTANTDTQLLIIILTRVLVVQ